MPIWGAGLFREKSYGGPTRTRSARSHVESGRRWVVDMGFEKFFDPVNHAVLYGAGIYTNRHR